MASVVHFDAPYLTIHWESDARCVHMQWKQFTLGPDRALALHPWDEEARGNRGRLVDH